MDNASQTAKTSEDSSQSKATLIKGSAWMTAGSIFSRILGAVYVIPWNNWFGSLLTAQLANSLFGKGYNIYSLFLIISTAGIPGAISKQIAHYNAINEYAVGNKLFKQGLKIMAITGLITAAIMYFGAPFLAIVLSGGDQKVVPILRALSWALLIIPIMSIVRGYFQGYAQMAPSAISQFIEQVARVIYILAATYFIMKIQHGSYISAVAQSTFAAFIGALFGLGILVWYFIRQLPHLRKLSQNSSNVVAVDEQNFFLEIWSQALPFIILDSGIVLFQIFDQSTFSYMMNSFHHFSEDTLSSLYALFGFNTNKIIMIVVSLSTALAITAVPLLSAAYSRKDWRNVSDQIGNTLQLFFLVMLPSALGMYAVARPLYILFYRYDQLGIYILQFNAIIAILLALFTVLSAILQGLYQNGLAIKYFIIGFIVKIVVQYPCVYAFKTFGPLMATGIGMSVTSLLMLRLLCFKFGFEIRQTLRRTMGILLLSILMLLVVIAVDYAGYQFIAPNNRILSVVLLVIEVIIGILIYGYCVLKVRIAEKIVGPRVALWRQKLHIK